MSTSGRKQTVGLNKKPSLASRKDPQSARSSQPVQPSQSKPFVASDEAHRKFRGSLLPSHRTQITSPHRERQRQELLSMTGSGSLTTRLRLSKDLSRKDQTGKPKATNFGALHLALPNSLGNFSYSAKSTPRYAAPNAPHTGTSGLVSPVMGRLGTRVLA